MNFKDFKLPDWLIVGGGGVVFLFGFFDWFDTGSASSSAFKFTVTGVFPWLLIVSSALLTLQIRTGILTVRKWPWPMIFLFATALGALLILLRAIIGAKLGDFGDLPKDVPNIRFGRKFTLWFSLLGALATAAGSALSFIGGGGTVDDLPLIGRIKAARSKPRPMASRNGGRVDGPSDPPGNDHSRRLPPAEQDRPFDADDDTNF